MLRLRNTKSESIVYLVVRDEGYSVGRKDCSIKIEGDQSISRKHALLTVQHPLSNVSHPDRVPALELKDSSKYGTLVNGKKIDLGSSVILKPGDSVSFGALNSNSWRVEYEPLVAACSGLSGKDKQELKKSLSQLGGHLLSEWTKDCTLLIMKEINVTAKVIGALVTCRYIVTPSYISKFMDAATADGRTPPDPSGFLPPVVERAINQDESLFVMKSERKMMLKGKTFIFLSQKQHKRLYSVIELAGGKAMLYSPDVCNQTLLQDPQTCVLQSEAADHTQTPGAVAQDVQSILKRKKLRMIGEAELGLAVLTASTGVYCNPSVPKEGVKLVNCMKDSQFVNVANQKVLVTDTEASETSYVITSDTNKIGQRKEVEVKRQEFEKPKERSIACSSTSGKKETTSGAGTLTSKNISETDESDDPFAESSKAKRIIKRPLSPERVVPPTVEAPEEKHYSKRIKVETVEEVAHPAAEVKHPLSIDGEAAHPAVVELKQEPQDLRGHVDVNANYKLAVKRESEERARVTDVPGVSEEEGSQSHVLDSEGSQSQWRKNKRRRRLLSEDEEDQGNDSGGVVTDEGIDGGETSHVPPLPGFISKKHRPGRLVKVETCVFEHDLPKHLVVVETVSLIVSKPATKNPVKANRHGQLGKNYKNFKKSSYAGQRILPEIIGGSDLVVYRIMQSQASQDLFHADVRNSDIDRAEALADELFSVEPRGRRAR